MKNNPNAFQQEPWLARLGDCAPVEDMATREEFVDRVMNAPHCVDAEPWLEWMAIDRAQDDPAFAGRVAHAFTAERSKRRTAGWIGRAAACLAASIALAVLLWPAATPTPPTPVAATIVQHPEEKASFTLAIQREAEGWIDHRTQLATASLTSTKTKVSTFVSQYAIPIQASCFFLGLGVPSAPQQNSPPDGGNAHDPRMP